jgi:tRNA nucleotidyltransferase (CCA-adding enzyme)
MTRHTDPLEEVYLVGGAVRDQLLGLESHDKDYVVVGATETQMKTLGFKAVGKDFPVFLHPVSKDEYALARTERKVGKGYTGFTVDASVNVTLEEDLARRDLSINAMALSKNNQLVDPFNGKQDLESKTLRHTTEAFTEDPVRVLRLARFLARYGSDWSIHEDTKALVSRMVKAGELAHLVPERVWKETEKALLEKHPQLYFEVLNELGVLRLLFPEIAQMVAVPQAPEHHPEGDVFVHTMLVLKRAADLDFDLPTRFAALTHDFGKAICYQQQENLHGHEADGVPIIEDFCERLRIPNKLRDIAKLTSDNHLLCHKMFELTPKTAQKLIVQHFDAVKQPQRFRQFLQACQCDAQGRGPALVDRPYPQADLAIHLLNGLTLLDTKEVVQQALAAGKTGPELGEAMRIAQITCVREGLSTYKKE